MLENVYFFQLLKHQVLLFTIFLIGYKNTEDVILKIFNGQQVLSVSGSWRTFHKKKSTPIVTNFWKDKIRCSQKPTSILNHTLTKRKRKKKLRCPLTVFITSVGSSILLHLQRRTDAGHLKITVQENSKTKIKTKKIGKGKTPRPANLAYLTALTNKTEIFLEHKPELLKFKPFGAEGKAYVPF